MVFADGVYNLKITKRHKQYTCNWLQLRIHKTGDAGIKSRASTAKIVYPSPSNLSSNPTSQSWNLRPLGGSDEALSRRRFSMSMIISEGSETSSQVVLFSNMPASKGEIDFQRIFMAGVPTDLDVVDS